MRQTDAERCPWIAEAVGGIFQYQWSFNAMIGAMLVLLASKEFEGSLLLFTLALFLLACLLRHQLLPQYDHWSTMIIDNHQPLTPFHLNIAVPFAEVLLLLSLRGFFDQNKNCTAFQVTVINILEIMQSWGIRWSCITTIQPNLNTSLSLLARTCNSFSHLPVLSSHDDVWLHLFWRCRLLPASVLLTQSSERRKRNRKGLCEGDSQKNILHSLASWRIMYSRKK